MGRFIIVTFVFLAFAFYQMSGGASFDPVEARDAAMLERTAEEARPKPTVRETSVAVAETPEPAATARNLPDATEADSVTRVSLNLTSLSEVLTVDEPKKAPRLPASELTPPTEPAAIENLEAEPTVILPSIIFGGSIAEASVTGTPLSNDIREVSGTTVNVRGGPGTGFDVVNQLQRGDSVEVLRDDGTGWVQLRPLNGGPVGWMADFLLSDG